MSADNSEEDDDDDDGRGAESLGFSKFKSLIFISIKLDVVFLNLDNLVIC